jgi:flagellar biosynthesis protein FlhF
MQIKRFEAKNMTEALKMIKKEFGSQAVILSAKTIKRSGGIFGAVRKAGVEITAASDRSRSIELMEKFPSDRKDDSNRQFNNNSITQDRIAKLDQEFRNKRKETNPLPSNPTNAQFDTPLIKKFALNLREQGVNDSLIRQIIEEISVVIEHQEKVGISDIKELFYQTINKKVIIAKQLEIKENKPNIVAFVGPTGVGKTTTIAKLSAINALEKKYSVALISLDHQRIGATTILEKYAGIIGLPYKTVRSKTELGSILSSFNGNNFIFVDTPGIAVVDKEKIDQLSALLASISPAEVHLLISAATKDKDMMRLCDVYAPCQINRLIFTKIDETSGFGNLLNLLDTKKMPLAYMTNGQQIPEHISSATSEIIPNLLFYSDFAQNLTNQKVNHRETIDSSKSIFLRAGDYYIANKNSDIFHHRTCKAVERINMNNVVVFQNISDARKQNFKPCRMCCYDKTSNYQSMQKFNQKIAASYLG